MSKLKKVLFIVLGMLMVLFLLSIKSHAASLTVSTSKSQVSPGETFSVTVSLSNGAGSISTTGHGVVWLDNSSYTYTMTAGNSNVSISASGVVGDYTTEKNENVSASCVVKVVSPQPTTTTNPTTNPTTNTSKPTLNNLGIKPYDFSGFRSTTFNYSVNVPNDCTQVTVYASSANGTVSGTGAINLKEGTNIATVTVSNANGSQKYTISINRANAEGEEVTNEIVETDDVEDNPVLGLSSLSIEGYTFDKEFTTDVFVYTVEIEKPLTQEELDQIKEKVVATTSSDQVVTETTATLDEDGNAVIKIVVKDAEKQYSEYMIRFEVKEKEDKAAVGAVVIPKNNNMDGLFTGITNKIYLILGLGILGYLIAMFMAIHARRMTSYLEEYEEEYYEDEEPEEVEELKTVSQYGKKPRQPEEPVSYIGLDENKGVDEAELTSDILSAPRDENLYARYEPSGEEASEDERIHELDEDDPSLKTVKDAATRASRMGGYRNLRSKRSTGGRHF